MSSVHPGFTLDFIDTPSGLQNLTELEVLETLDETTG